jgi:hypothetical protein
VATCHSDTVEDEFITLERLKWVEPSNHAATREMAALEHEAVDAHRWRECLNWDLPRSA